jgi:hypothetical protein
VQRDLIFANHAANIDEGVAHTTEGGIDADAGEFGDFFERKVDIMAQNDDLALLGGERVDELADFAVRLVANYILFFVAVGIFDERKDVEIVVVGHDRRAAFVFAEIIDTEIVGNAHSPLQKLAFFVVSTTAEGVDDFDESLLKNVVGEVGVADEDINRSIDFRFMAIEKHFECLFVAAHVQADKVAVAAEFRLHNSLIFTYN